MARFVDFAEDCGVPDDAKGAWQRFRPWVESTVWPPAKIKDAMRAEKFATPALVDFLADVFATYLADRQGDVGGHKHVAYALWPVIASGRHDAALLDHAERHFADGQHLNALRVRRYVAWRDGKTPSALLRQLDEFADRAELVTDQVRLFAETLKLKFEPREPWQLAFNLKDERLKSLAGPRPLPHPVLAVRLNYPGTRVFGGLDWGFVLEYVSGDGSVSWHDGAAPKIFSPDPDVEAQLGTLSWPAAGEPLDLPTVIRGIERNFSIKLDRAALYLGKSEAKAIQTWLDRALSAADPLR